jgi:hypothetical protein
LRRLAQQGGLPLVGIPTPIDNDVRDTEASVGYDTAVAVATEALDRLQPTAASHDRVMVLEVMGRDAGHIAIAAGIAGGADVVLIPEIPYRMEVVAAHIDRLRQGGRNFALVLVAESIRDPSGDLVHRRHAGGQKSYGGVGAALADAIAHLTGAETRVTVLGHLQRGGQPTAGDRLLASAFGVYAVDLVAAGRFDRMVAWQNRRVVDVPLAVAIAMPHCVDPDGALGGRRAGWGSAWAMADADEPPSWRFSLAFYAAPGVARALMALQDRDGLDVNLMLFALWIGVSGHGRLASDGLRAAERAVCTIRAGGGSRCALAAKPRQNPDVEVMHPRRGEGTRTCSRETGSICLAHFADSRVALDMPVHCCARQSGAFWASAGRRGGGRDPTGTEAFILED